MPGTESAFQRTADSPASASFVYQRVNSFILLSVQYEFFFYIAQHLLGLHLDLAQSGCLDSRCNTGSLLATLQGHTSWIWSVRFHPAGHLLATGSYDATVCVWHTLWYPKLALDQRYP